MHGRRQHHVQRARLGGHVADHLIVGEDVVAVEQAVVVHTLPAQRHLGRRRRRSPGRRGERSLEVDQVKSRVEGVMRMRKGSVFWSWTYPVRGAEVDRLCKVEALVEATVVGSGKGDHKLPGTLVCPVNLEGDGSIIYGERGGRWTGLQPCRRLPTVTHWRVDVPGPHGP